MAKHDFANRGIDCKIPTMFFSFYSLVSELKLNLFKMMDQKDKAVSGLTKGIEMLFKKNKITRYLGHGKIIDSNSIEVMGDDGKSEKIKAKNIVIATGSDIFEISGLSFDEKTIISSTGALQLKEVPKKMVVIGGGVIGLELVEYYIIFH